MKIKHTIMMGLLVSGVNLFAGEPFLLKTGDAGEFLKKKPLLASKKKSLAANAAGESNVAIKLNLSQLAFKNISLQGEYGFHNKMSVALGVSYFLKRDIPSTFYETDENFGPINYGGFAITPEFRFYPGGREDKPAPQGFYIAAYVRYAKYKMTQTVSYQETPTSQKYTATAEQTYGGVNGGVMIGKQWIINKHFNIDWWIIGAGYGKAKYTYGWSSPNANLTAKQQEDVKREAEANFDEFSAIGLEGSVTTTKNSATMTIKGLPMYSIRFMGLCLGYAF